MLYDGEEIDMPIIDLSIETFGLLFLWASGVLYTNQTGGYATLHPHEEGVYAPLQLRESVQTAITKHFTGRKWRGWCFEGIDEETAQFLDGVFMQSDFLPFLRVDRSRLQDSHEA